MKNKILYIEDEPDHAALIKLWLERNDFIISIAGSGKEGLERIEKERPDLVLLDIMLPDIGGTEVCKRIKTGSNSANIPVLIVSGAGRKEVRDASFKSGADDFIDKPVSPKDLLVKMRALLEKNSVK